MRGEENVKPFAVRFTQEAAKDVKKLTPALKKKLKTILTKRIAVDPFAGKKLVGDLSGLYSVRLSYQDRIVYSVDPKTHTIYVHRARTHYGE
jgi:mRNA interferase RelE/StbE